MESVSTSKKKLLFILGFFFLAFVLYGVAYIDFENYGHCELIRQQSQLRKYFDKLTEKPTRQALFWSSVHYRWLKQDIEKGRAQLGMDSSACAPRFFFHDSHFSNSWGGWLFPTLHESYNSKLKSLQQLSRSIAEHLRTEYHQRGEWMARLYVDLNKVCQLKKNTDRFQKLLLYLNSTCRVPAAVTPAASCGKEIQKLEKIIHREEQPYLENYSKLESKWPFVRSDLAEITQDCQRLSEWIELE